MLTLEETSSFSLKPRAPYNFDANLHKPSHFPSLDTAWEPGRCWTTMVWNGRVLGLDLRSTGSTGDPRIELAILSKNPLTASFLAAVLQEVKWRFNLDQDISEFGPRYENDEFLRLPLLRLEGMKPIAANSLYESLMIYVVLQNATVRRSAQMLESLFGRFGKRVSFDGQTLSAFWRPASVTSSSLDELRGLRVGYRAKSIMKISERFASGAIDGAILRHLSREEVKRELLELYGVGPASTEYLLFDDFYFLDALETIPPWEQKIMSRLLFGRRLVPVGRILRFFRSRYPRYEKLAFHYIWEDLFWRRKEEHIPWLEKEIRL